jgi:hypothetical protein
MGSVVRFLGQDGLAQRVPRAASATQPLLLGDIVHDHMEMATPSTAKQPAGALGP